MASSGSATTLVAAARRSPRPWQHTQHITSPHQLLRRRASRDIIDDEPLSLPPPAGQNQHQHQQSRLTPRGSSSSSSRSGSGSSSAHARARIAQHPTPSPLRNPRMRDDSVPRQRRRSSSSVTQGFLEPLHTSVADINRRTVSRSADALTSLRTFARMLFYDAEQRHLALSIALILACFAFVLGCTVWAWVHVLTLSSSIMTTMPAAMAASTPLLLQASLSRTILPQPALFHASLVCSVLTPALAPSFTRWISNASSTQESLQSQSQSQSHLQSHRSHADSVRSEDFEAYNWSSVSVHVPVAVADADAILVWSFHDFVRQPLQTPLHPWNLSFEFLSESNKTARTGALIHQDLSKLLQTASRQHLDMEMEMEMDIDQGRPLACVLVLSNITVNCSPFCFRSTATVLGSSVDTLLDDLDSTSFSFSFFHSASNSASNSDLLNASNDSFVNTTIVIPGARFTTSQLLRTRMVLGTLLRSLVVPYSTYIARRAVSVVQGSLVSISQATSSVLAAAPINGTSPLAFVAPFLATASASASATGRLLWHYFSFDDISFLAALTALLFTLWLLLFSITKGHAKDTECFLSRIEVIEENANVRARAMCVALDQFALAQQRVAAAKVNSDGDSAGSVSSVNSVTSMSRLLEKMTRKVDRLDDCMHKVESFMHSFGDIVPLVRASEERSTHTVEMIQSMRSATEDHARAMADVRARIDVVEQNAVIRASAVLGASGQLHESLEAQRVSHDVHLGTLKALLGDKVDKLLANQELVARVLQEMGGALGSLKAAHAALDADHKCVAEGSLRLHESLVSQIDTLSASLLEVQEKVDASNYFVVMYGEKLQALAGIADSATEAAKASTETLGLVREIQDSLFEEEDEDAENENENVDAENEDENDDAEDEDEDEVAGGDEDDEEAKIKDDAAKSTRRRIQFEQDGAENTDVDAEDAEEDDTVTKDTLDE